MTRTTFVAMTIITLGFASGAFAQSVDGTYSDLVSPRATVLPMDSLDPVSRAAMLAMRSSRPTTSAPTTSPTNVVLFSPSEMPAPAPQPQPTRIAEEQPAGPSRFFSVLNGISAGLQVSHEALDVYEHAIEANALKNYYNGR